MQCISAKLYFDKSVQLIRGYIDIRDFVLFRAKSKHVADFNLRV